jgi:hypothetical protein
MTLLTLKDVAEYVRTSNASRVLITILHRTRRVFNFIEERHNRLSRYVAVVNAYKSQMPLAAIEEKFGCTRRTIYDYVERAGVPRRSFKPEEVKAAALKEYADKSVPIASIISRYNVSYRQLHTWARKAGIRRNRKR